MSDNPAVARPPGAGSRRLLLLAAVVVAAIDLVAKALAEARLSDTPVNLGLLQLRLAHNSGVAFSLGDALPTSVVAALTAAITAVIALYGWRHAPTASRIQVLAAHPTQARTVFAGGDTGLFVSRDGGARWERIGASGTLPTIWSLAAAASDACFCSGRVWLRTRTAPPMTRTVSARLKVGHHPVWR